MGFLAKIPWGKVGKGVTGFMGGPWGQAIALGGSLLGGWLGGKKATSSAMARSPEEQAALSGAQDAAGQFGRYGQELYSGGRQTLGQGTEMLGTAGNYWDTLLRGSRAAMSQATAGPRAALTEQYRGAERGLERSGLRGAVKDLASANLSRDRAGQIAGLTTGVQPMAAQGLAGIGGELGGLGLSQLGQGLGATEAGANIWQRLLGAGFENRKYGRAEGAIASKNIGSLIFDILSGLGKRGPKLPGSTVGLPKFPGQSGFPGLPGGARGPF